MILKRTWTKPLELNQSLAPGTQFVTGNILIFWNEPTCNGSVHLERMQERMVKL